VVAAAMVGLPWPAWVTAPVLLGVYYAALLWRFAFARHYRTHRRGWWLTPLVKLVADAGAEAGRLRELPGALRRWRAGGGAGELARG
jgi:hypothetical protein